jgi:choline-sulfatase
LYPTLIDLCGVTERKELAGHSLVPLLKDPEAAWDHPSITTYLPGNHAVRTEHWRYIRYATGDEELYDHRNDPNEWNNLVGITAFEKIRNQLAGKLPSDEK